WKISTEYDVAAGEANSRQPDTDMFRIWEIAGTSHVDHHLRMSREPLELRDIGTSSEAMMATNCTVPTVGTRAPIQFVIAAAFDGLVKWLEKRTPPPTALPITISSFGPPVVVSRNKLGLALGGIRLPQVAVPIAENNGTNTGQGA